MRNHFFCSQENFTTFQHSFFYFASFLFYGLEIWTVSLFLLQMNVSQINVKNLFWDTLFGNEMLCQETGWKNISLLQRKRTNISNKKISSHLSFAKKLQKPKHHPQHPSTYVGNKLQKPKTSKLLGNCSMSTCYRRSSSSSREINKASSAAVGQKTWETWELEKNSPP